MKAKAKPNTAKYRPLDPEQHHRIVTLLERLARMIADKIEQGQRDDATILERAANRLRSYLRRRTRANDSGNLLPYAERGWTKLPSIS
jgi:hypothetical protein